MNVRVLLLMVAALSAVAPAALAVSDDISASADVQMPLSVIGSSDLNFGIVFPGVNKSVAYGDAANAGQWDIVGAAGAEVTLSFTALPANLESGGNRLAIVYGTTDAAHNTTDDPATGTAFDPAVGATADAHAVSGALFVWIGGTVQPLETQPTGVYTATITLDVSYTGN